MMLNLVTEDGIIRTYPPETQKICEEYFRVINARKETNSCTKKISQMTGVSKSRVKHWIYDKVKPIPVKIVEKLESKRLLPLTTENPNFGLIVECAAFIFGDGHLNENVVIFSSKYESDLALLKNSLYSIGFKGRVRKRITKNYKMPDGKILNGISYSLFISSSALARLFIALHIPKGNKVLNPVRIPNWLFRCKDNVKSRFLGVFYANEGCTPVFSKSGLSGMVIKLSKNIALKKDHKIFLNQLRKLFDDLGIKTSRIYWINIFNSRKDGITTQSARFHINNNFENFLNFCNNIPILYNSKKSDALTIVKSKVISRIKKYLVNCRKYNETMELLNDNMNLHQISKKLHINYKTLKYWVKKGKPVLYDKQQILDKLIATV